jgi:hypothetical protein
MLDDFRLLGPLVGVPLAAWIWTWRWVRTRNRGYGR